MANVLPIDKRIAVIGALAEGSSIRSIERITGIHRDTIMRLGVRIGNGCTALMNDQMRDLSCNRLEVDEIWGFVGKKERNVKEGDSERSVVCGHGARSMPRQNSFLRSRSAIVAQRPLPNSCRTWLVGWRIESNCPRMALQLT